MNKPSIWVIIEHDVQLTAPGMLGRKFDFKSGCSFQTQEWFFPGELFENGLLAGTPRDRWSFMTNMGTDLPLTFDGSDIQKVVILTDLETFNPFEKAPFQVIVKNY